MRNDIRLVERERQIEQMRLEAMARRVRQNPADYYRCALAAIADAVPFEIMTDAQETNREFARRLQIAVDALSGAWPREQTAKVTDPKPDEVTDPKLSTGAP